MEVYYAIQEEVGTGTCKVRWFKDRKLVDDLVLNDDSFFPSGASYTVVKLERCTDLSTMGLKFYDDDAE